MLTRVKNAPCSLNVIEGNIFDCDAQAIVNPVNCVGVMGKGLAAQFKKQWPQMFIDYKMACQDGRLKVGTVHLYALERTDGNLRYIINFPTKKHWKDQSELEDIYVGLYALKDIIEQYDLKSIAMPALGCGLGGLEWDRVKDLIELWYNSEIKHTTVWLHKP